jgi:hypothetical protein
MNIRIFKPRFSIRTESSALLLSWLARRDDAAAYMPQGGATQSRRLKRSAIDFVALHANGEGIFSLVVCIHRPHHEVVAV